MLCAHKLHEQSRRKAVDTAFHQHSGENGGGRHTGEQRGKSRACQTAEQPVGPAADQSAEQHGDVHGQIDGPGIGYGVECLGQHYAEGNADCGDNGFFYSGHLLHVSFLLHRYKI